MSLPSRRQQAQADRDRALHLLKKAAAAEAEIEAIDRLEDERQFWALLRASHEERAQFAGSMEQECADRQASAFLRLDSRPATTTDPPASVS
jgi:hypothetical protein